MAKTVVSKSFLLGSDICDFGDSFAMFANLKFLLVDVDFLFSLFFCGGLLWDDGLVELCPLFFCQFSF